MRKSELISDIREILRAHNIDSEIADRHIMFLIRTKRAKYLRQRELREMEEYGDQFKQSIFMALELVDASRYPNINLGKTVLRTVKSLPNIIGREILKHMDIRTVEYTGKEFEVLSKERATFVTKAPSGFIYAYKEDDGRLIFYSPEDSVYKTLKQVVVQTILEDPEDIVSLNDLTTPLDDYPITGELWEIVKPEILQELMTSLGIPIDTLNDKADDASQPQK
jgi:hypothetical protein